MKHILYLVDHRLLSFVQSLHPWAGRVALFIVFFWFGTLKVMGLSPADEIVIHLQ